MLAAEGGVAAIDRAWVPVPAVEGLPGLTEPVGADLVAVAEVVVGAGLTVREIGPVLRVEGRLADAARVLRVELVGLVAGAVDEAGVRAEVVLAKTW